MKMKAMGALMHMGRILHILFRFGCFYEPLLHIRVQNRRKESRTSIYQASQLHFRHFLVSKKKKTSRSQSPNLHNVSS